MSERSGRIQRERKKKEGVGRGGQRKAERGRGGERERALRLCHQLVGHSSSCRSSMEYSLMSAEVDEQAGSTSTYDDALSIAEL